MNCLIRLEAKKDLWSKSIQKKKVEKIEKKVEVARNIYIYEDDQEGERLPLNDGSLLDRRLGGPELSLFIVCVCVFLFLGAPIFLLCCS